MNYDDLARRVIDGHVPSREEALSIIVAPSSDLMHILNASFKIREKNFKRFVQIHYLINAKSGICPEDCSYCSQSSVSESDIEKYGLVDEVISLYEKENADYISNTNPPTYPDGLDIEIFTLKALVCRAKNTLGRFRYCGKFYCFCFGQSTDGL